MAEGTESFINKSIAVNHGDLKSLDEALSWVVQIVDGPDFTNSESFRIEIASMTRLQMGQAPDQAENVFVATVSGVVPFESPKEVLPNV